MSTTAARMLSHVPPSQRRIQSLRKAILLSLLSPLHQRPFKIYINFASDTILLPFLDSVRTFFDKQPRLCPGKEYIKLIQNIALTTIATIVLRGPQFWRPLETLEKVTFLKPERMTDTFKDKMDLFRMTLNDAREQNSKKRKSKENGDDILELVLKNDFMQILNFDELWKG